VGLVIGTQGLAPDESILGRPGHGRKAQAICAWLNGEFGKGKQVAWAKQDPTRTDTQIPEDLAQQWFQFQAVFKRYGNVIYALFVPGSDRSATTDAVTAFLDLFFEERGFEPLKAFNADRDRIRAKWFEYLMPTLDKAEVRHLLGERKYVIVQGPPGTGKTRMATKLLIEDYGSHGRSIQFHPNSTYESFIGGLAPVQSAGELGLQFRPKAGFLMEAAAQAAQSPSRPYLLHIDEINRADLSKILGEAIYLLEAKPDTPRKISLPYHFGEPIQDLLELPQTCTSWER
jgi:5-methylcytosine-specific restriction protein B